MQSSWTKMAIWPRIFVARLFSCTLRHYWLTCDVKMCGPFRHGIVAQKKGQWGKIASRFSLRRRNLLRV
jgi:hypothetical protein